MSRKVEQALARARQRALAVAASHRSATGAVRTAQTEQAVRALDTISTENPVRSWVRDGIGERVFVAAATGQEVVAGMAGDYVSESLSAQGLAVDVPQINASRFAGIASDGRDLDSLLAGAAIRVRQARLRGESPARALMAGKMWLRMVMDTQINDASRAADSVAIATADAYQGDVDEQPASPQARLQDRAAAALAGGTEARRPISPAEQRAQLLARIRARQGGGVTPTERRAQVERLRDETLARIENARREREAARARARGAGGDPLVGRAQVEVGYVRLLTPPSCARCAILAGRFYRWSEGFERHEMCDCRHVPATQEVGEGITSDPVAYFESLSKEQQDYYFGKANAEAIRAGADLYQVVNAQDGMRTADDGRRYTTRPRSRRSRRGSPPVLRPTVWQIYQDARGDRERARKALEFNGYITTSRAPAR